MLLVLTAVVFAVINNLFLKMWLVSCPFETNTLAITVAVNVPPTSVAAIVAVEPVEFSVMVLPVVVQGMFSPTLSVEEPLAVQIIMKFSFFNEFDNVLLGVPK